MKKLHRFLAAVALGVVFSSGVILSSLGLASAQEPDAGNTPIITFPLDTGEYNEEQWNAGCNPVGFCGTATASATGSGVQKFEISIQQRGAGNFWDGTQFATGSAVFVMAEGLEDWSYSFPFGDFPAGGEYTVQARSTDDSGNVKESPVAAFTIDTGLPKPPKPPKDGIKEGKPRGFNGVVDGEQGSEPPNPFTLIRQGGGELVEIHLPSEGFEFKTPGGPRKGIFEGGARVVVRVRWTDGMWIVEKGLVKPVKPIFTPSVGVVVNQEKGKLTLRLPNGKKLKIKISDQGKPSELGEVVTVFTAQADVDNGPLEKATGLVRASEVRQRLERFLEDVNESPGQISEKSRKARSKRVANLAVALDDHSAKHVAILEGLADQEDLLPQTNVAIGRALKNSKLRREKALKIAADARERAGPPEGRGKPDSTGKGKPASDTSALADQGDKGRGKPDSTGQGNPARGTSSPAGQGNPAGDTSSPAGQGDKGNGKSGKGGPK